MPVVTTLHTVLEEPKAGQRHVMERILAISSSVVVMAEKGRDPRRFTLIAFGGAGPVHACDLARLLKIKRVLVPLGAGVASAIGFLVAPPATDLVRSLVGRLERLDWAKVAALYAEMVAEARGLLLPTAIFARWSR